MLTRDEAFRFDLCGYLVLRDVLPRAPLLAIARRGGEPRTACLGIAHPPFDAWTWTDLAFPVHGPDLVRLTDGRWIVGGRAFDGEREPYTALYALDPEGVRRDPAPAERRRHELSGARRARRHADRELLLEPRGAHGRLRRARARALTADRRAHGDVARDGG